jgi:hypothetical protein
MVYKLSWLKLGKWYTLIYTQNAVKQLYQMELWNKHEC